MLRFLSRISPAQWLWAAVGLGLALRLLHWARDPVVWEDEAALLINIQYLGFRNFLGPLHAFQAAPPLFMCLERLALLTLGESPPAVRLPVVLAACLALVLFADLARRVLSPRLAVVAAGLFAVSDRFLWHAIEVKPYTFDVLAAVVVAWGYVRTRGWGVAAQCGLWALVLPVLLWASYPSCFAAGGLLLALLPAAWRGGWGGRLAYAGLGLAVAGSFVALALGPAAAQRSANLANYWVNYFADWGRPAWVPVWVCRRTLDIVDYPLLPAGKWLLPVAVVGAVRLARRDPRLLVLLAAPAGLNLIAALIGRYPYGAGRLSVILAPAVLLLTAAGVGAARDWLAARGRYAPAVLVLLLSLPFAAAGFRTVVPWSRPDFESAVRYAEAEFRPGDVILAQYWEVVYYTRAHPERTCQLPAVTARHPARLWVPACLDRGEADAAAANLPPGWHEVSARTFRGTRVMLFEPDPPPGPSIGNDLVGGP